MLFSIGSFLLLAAYMLFGILEEPAASVGDLNLLPIVLFIISFPAFIVIHVWITADLLLFSKLKAES